jgi:hypothetical protein
MRIARFVLAAWVLAASAGCAAPAVVAPEEERAGAAFVVLDAAGVFVEMPGDGEEVLGAFLPAEWWEEGAETEPSVGDIVLVRRPRPRGTGPGPRRQPPLLNPGPTPETLRYWTRRTVNPKVVEQTRRLYYQRLAEAQALYPNSSGYQNHHAVPIYLGGPRNGMTYRLLTPYHQAITQEFRRQWGYGREDKPNPQQLMDLLIRVYGKYPIPQLVGIEP